MSERYPDESDRSNSSFKETRNKMKERVEYKKTKNMRRRSSKTFSIEGKLREERGAI